MSFTLLDKLRAELDLAKRENPDLSSHLNSELNPIIEKSANDELSSKVNFDHASHNSHGDWGKHWAHGGYEEDESTSGPGL